MNARIAAVIAVGFLIVPSGAVPSRAEVGAPRWSPGDSWTYDVQTTVEAGLVLNGTLHVAVTGVGPTVVKGVPLTAFRALLTGGGEVRGGTPELGFQGQWSLAGEQWIESTGMKIVRSVSQIDADGTTQPLPVGFSFQVQNTTESAVISDTWRYPIDAGTVGTLVTNTTSEETVRIRTGTNTKETTWNATYERIVTLNVTQAVPVRVVFGVVDALEIRVGWPSGEVDRWYFAAGVGNNARTETYNATGERVAESSLRSFRYQASESPPSFLGLPLLVGYAIVGSAAAATGIAVIAVWRQRRRSREADRGAPRDLSPPPGAI